ncbi:hypothetical protein [Hymenobacter cellulosilyticus]|uniref:Uncharacterized protein n=1 Tax=Hymenobacter cellulosilyticus TaxID=2932248 RepID=A0A8T9Q3H6_9BACT|nr:hypothetical protein [Hymenobacter cellulosilyticus]UOQ69999.1 hypothetical protein MUN79_14485 [Hymenobacter cellulosilyticus]
MKYLLPAALLGALLTGLTASAQTGPITLTQANFPASPTAVDRYLPMHGGQHPDFVLPQPGPNQVWDYRTLTADSSALEQTYFAPPATGPFANDTRGYTLSAHRPRDYAFSSPGSGATLPGSNMKFLLPAAYKTHGSPYPGSSGPFQPIAEVQGAF